MRCARPQPRLGRSLRDVQGRCRRTPREGTRSGQPSRGQPRWVRRQGGSRSRSWSRQRSSDEAPLRSFGLGRLTSSLSGREATRAGAGDVAETGRAEGLTGRRGALGACPVGLGLRSGKHRRHQLHGLAEAQRLDAGVDEAGELAVGARVGHEHNIARRPTLSDRFTKRGSHGYRQLRVPSSLKGPGHS